MFGKYVVAAALLLGTLFSGMGISGEVSAWLNWSKVEARVVKVYALCDISQHQTVDGDSQIHNETSVDCDAANKIKETAKNQPTLRVYVYKRSHYSLIYNWGQNILETEIRSDGRPIGEGPTMFSRKIKAKQNDIIMVRVSPKSDTRVRSLTDWKMFWPFLFTFIGCLLGLTLDQWSALIAGRTPRRAPLMWMFEP